jgi:Tfp pilus assembly protein PilX
MASATASKINRRRRRSPRPWTARWTLTWRILAVNIFAVLLLALGVIYLDAFRNKLSEERIGRFEREAEISAITAASVTPERRARRLPPSARQPEAGFVFTTPRDGSPPTAGR